MAPKPASNQVRFIRDLNVSGARFMVIGGKAIQALGLPRKTVDLDIWVSHAGTSPDQMWAVLRGLIGERADEYREKLRYSNVRLCIPYPEQPDIDILTSVGELEFDDVYRNSSPLMLHGHAVRVPCIADLIRTKEVVIRSTQEQISTGRLASRALRAAQSSVRRDQEDIEALTAFSAKHVGRT